MDEQETFSRNISQGRVATKATTSKRFQKQIERIERVEKNGIEEQKNKNRIE